VTNLSPALADLLAYLAEIGYGDLYLPGRMAAEHGPTTEDGSVKKEKEGWVGKKSGETREDQVERKSWVRKEGRVGKESVSGSKDQRRTKGAGESGEGGAEPAHQRSESPSFSLPEIFSSSPSSTPSLFAPAAPEVPENPAAREAALAALGEKAAVCTRCRLAGGRQTVVFGCGNPHADLMFVGEAPGAEEDRQGLPFVGRAGELLNRIIHAIELRREDVYIANILKCRPPGNRDPMPDEAAACMPFLEQQIALVRPRVLVALGRIAAQVLLGSDTPIGRMRGQWFRVQDVPTMVTYHPAALLRNPALKRPTWEDMQQVRDRLRAG
jgi:DNA polymerase